MLNSRDDANTESSLCQVEALCDKSLLPLEFRWQYSKPAFLTLFTHYQNAEK